MTEWSIFLQHHDWTQIKYTFFTCNGPVLLYNRMTHCMFTATWLTATFIASTDQHIIYIAYSTNCQQLHHHHHQHHHCQHWRIQRQAVISPYSKFENQEFCEWISSYIVFTFSLTTALSVSLPIYAHICHATSSFLNFCIHHWLSSSSSSSSSSAICQIEWHISAMCLSVYESVSIQLVSRDIQWNASELINNLLHYACRVTIIHRQCGWSVLQLKNCQMSHYRQPLPRCLLSASTSALQYIYNELNVDVWYQCFDCWLCVTNGHWSVINKHISDILGICLSQVPHRPFGTRDPVTRTEPMV